MVEQGYSRCQTERMFPSFSGDGGHGAFAKSHNATPERRALFRLRQRKDFPFRRRRIDVAAKWLADQRFQLRRSPQRGVLSDRAVKSDGKAGFGSQADRGQNLFIAIVMVEQDVFPKG